eukprot:CAMPEP_0196762688 /NCGR_PEP_ID=MMETSP1095-20130614/2556_1 /TAXON_ID=96789 ORGANISM="Chromulina nebulosa, Strain UTEXLB2642" /NCGR_SAMPLE_ID=MMETSP1095 /ASSEMBLY_ACC=CAM_ASM_000446 /LENGTH=533 /DNA_ID=CAMNT_0042114243 /DNA_START=219 /DNA_END=1821 /DNA_ORIENTATION=+
MSIMSQSTSLSDYTPRTTLSSRAMRRGGFNVNSKKSNDNKDIYTDNYSGEFNDNINDFNDDESVANDFDNEIDDEYRDTSDIFIGSSDKFRKREEQMKQQRNRGEVKIAGISAKRSQLVVDQEAWEDNRLIQSGVGILKDVQMNFDNDEDNRIQLIVHTLKPPFLDGRIKFSLIQTTISIVKDPTSDMAVNARNGSNLLKEKREQKDQMKMRKRFWELGGSKMGNAIGVAKPDEEKDETVPFTATGIEDKNKQSIHREDLRDDDHVNYKDGSSFIQHMKDMKTEARSTFSITKSIQEQREYLPIFTVKNELLNIIRENQVLIVVGETGSGKTTQLTQYLSEFGYSDYGMIGCTQPRRVAAMSVAKRVADEFNCQLGEEVGYAIRFEDCTSSKTLIKYMTDGVLLRESLREPNLDTYSCIVMDEAHERSLHTDVLFGILKKIITHRRDMKLIVTSATLNAEKFSQFFGYAPVFRIPGRTFNVEKYYSKVPVDDYVDAAVKQVLTIHLSLPSGDILVFMTGQEDIEMPVKSLQKE